MVMLILPSVVVVKPSGLGIVVIVGDVDALGCALGFPSITPPHAVTAITTELSIIAKTAGQPRARADASC
ncbi:hypothetical protein ACFYV7_31640 [Nocardia suismassiliense]|uniref:Uncharacterized protein n=1 Tax=Nocardia suismassiliense TaxID=2077092 RepID=A0ABW6R3L5_9NOCA